MATIVLNSEEVIRLAQERVGEIMSLENEEVLDLAKSQQSKKWFRTKKGLDLLIKEEIDKRYNVTDPDLEFLNGLITAAELSVELGTGTITVDSQEVGLLLGG